MLVLAIDTALAACSAAVLDSGQDAIVARKSVGMNRGHAEALMPLLERVLEHAGLNFEAIDRIAVTTGPGSFTGLRVGIAAARGFGLAGGKSVVGLSTLSAYAAPFIAADDSVPVVAAIDARHEHVYLQILGPGGHAVFGPRFLHLREALRVISAGAPRITGNAADVLAAAWPTDTPAPRTVDQRAAPDIEWVARLGAAAVDTGMPPKPLYLRAPDAQPQGAAKLARR